MSKAGWLFVHSDLDDAGLDPEAFRVLCHVARRSGRAGVYAAVSSMAKTCGLNRKTVIDRLSKLVSAGWIVRTNRPGRSTLYTLPPSPPDGPGSQPATWAGPSHGSARPAEPPSPPDGPTPSPPDGTRSISSKDIPKINPPPPREGACDAPEVSEPAAVKDEDEEFLGWGERQGMPRDGLLRIIEMDREGVIKKSRRGYAKACHEKKEWPEGKRSQHKKSKSTDPREHVRTARRREFEAWAAKPYPDFDTDALIERDNIVDEFLAARPNGSEAERDFANTGLISTAGENLREVSA